MMSTLTAHCHWEDKTVRERTGHPSSYAVAKKMKSLTLHTPGCPRASLMDCSSSCPILQLLLRESMAESTFTGVVGTDADSSLHTRALSFSHHPSGQPSLLMVHVNFIA